MPVRSLTYERSSRAPYLWAGAAAVNMRVRFWGRGVPASSGRCDAGGKCRAQGLPHLSAFKHVPVPRRLEFLLGGVEIEP